MKMNDCLQIHALNFDNNGEIIAIVSAENEVVGLTRKINPASANVSLMLKPFKNLNETYI